jgi:hypothetical protein
MPRLIFRITLFLSSFAPLFALMAFENRHVPLAFWPLIAACIIGVAGLAAVMHALRSEVGAGIKVAHAVPKDGEVLSYIAAYLVPFLAVDLSKTNDAVLFSGFLAVLCIVYINSNMIFVNPLLSIAGFHTFEVSDKYSNVFTVLTRQHDIVEGTTIFPAQIDRHLRVDSHWQREN